MCKKIENGKMNVEELNAMAIGSDFMKLNHNYNFYEVGDYKGITTEAICGNKKLHFVGGILVEVEEVE